MSIMNLIKGEKMPDKNDPPVQGALRERSAGGP